MTIINDDAWLESNILNVRYFSLLWEFLKFIFFS
jgi:hypothetical protein